MKPNGPLTFVGFGFGPIQAGLFVLEALRSGNFSRIVIAEVLHDVVEAVREARGSFRLNIAHADRLESLTLGPVEMLDPAIEEDREALIAAVASASEIATAVPSVRYYRNDSPGSIHRILARGLLRRGGAPAIVYAAENHHRAAEVLREAVLSEVPSADRAGLRASVGFADTVIGKMSAVIADPERLAATGLWTITPRDRRAFLVETFNTILVSRIAVSSMAPPRRGIEVFEEKADLVPFEDAKLYGHNAAHALAAYLASLRNLVEMESLRKVPGAVELVRDALVEESGKALCRKWSGKDPLFTEEGFSAHASGLLERIFNPFLGDLVERVARDPERKLGWDDRLVGAMRLALSVDVLPRRLALGAAAALLHHEPGLRDEGAPAEDILEDIWRPSFPDLLEKVKVLELVREALPRLRRWLRDGSALSSF